MVKLLSLALLALAFTQTASAMPCDTGYVCKSQSGRYQIDLRRCRYRNDLNLSELKIAGKFIEAAALSAAFDGAPVQSSLLAFEVSVPTSDESVRVLSVETNKGKGTVREMGSATQPAPLKVIHSESISCKIED